MLPALSAARAAVVRARPRTRRRARKRLQLDSWSACTSWGNGNIIGSRMKRNDNTDVLVAERVVHDTYRSTPYPKWVPSRDLWTSTVLDSEDHFGALAPGHEVEVLVQSSGSSSRSRESMRWAPGLVIAVDRERNLAAVSIAEEFAREVAEAEIGAGNLRRQEDDRFVIDPKVVSDVAAHRSRSLHEAVFRLGMELTNHADRSYVVTVLARMGQPDLAKQLAESNDATLSSLAVRELGHALALAGDIQAVRSLLELLQRPEQAAQLLLEVSAICLNATIIAEREKAPDTEKIFSNVDYNAEVRRVVEDIRSLLPLLHGYANDVRSMPASVDRRGLAEAFNELLAACGRAQAVAEGFIVLEWMESMRIPKDKFTYEYIGFNVVRKTSLLKRVWALPLMPNEGPPEVVFAGRSNVGKSSLVNMLLNNNTLAPTSQRPGKTKTIDFFDVNANHPTLPQFRLVDVPGLGFARVSRDMRQRWIELIGGYFLRRRSLKIVFHLLDAGLCEIMAPDYDLWKLLAQAKRDDFQLCIALTKADHSSQAQLDRFAQKVVSCLRAENSDITMSAMVFACSSRSKLGKDTLWRKIYSTIGAAKVTDELKAISPGHVAFTQSEFDTSEPEEEEEARPSEAKSAADDDWEDEEFQFYSVGPEPEEEARPSTAERAAGDDWDDEEAQVEEPYEAQFEEEFTNGYGDPEEEAPPGGPPAKRRLAILDALA